MSKKWSISNRSRINSSFQDNKTKSVASVCIRKSWPVRKINRLIQFLNKEIEKGVRKSADCAEIGDAVWHTPFLLSRIAYSFLLAPRIRFTFCSLNFSRNYTILVKVRPHETFGSERVKKTGGRDREREKYQKKKERGRRGKRLNEGKKKGRGRKTDERRRRKEASEGRKEREREYSGGKEMRRKMEENRSFFFFFWANSFLARIHTVNRVKAKLAWVKWNTLLLSRDVVAKLVNRIHKGEWGGLINVGLSGDR